MPILVEREMNMFSPAQPRSWFVSKLISHGQSSVLYNNLITAATLPEGVFGFRLRARVHRDLFQHKAYILSVVTSKAANTQE